MNQTAPFRVAVITTVYNERIFLPIWLTYYGQEFGLNNLYIIDDGSTDGSTDEVGSANVIKVDQPEIDQKRRCRDVSFFFNEVLKHYDAAIYVDIDEFLVVDPLLRMGLRDFIQRSPLDHFNALGLNVIQNPSGEAACSAALGIFEQRRFVQFERGYCKQLIHRQPTFWNIGFHWTTQPVAMAAGLYLFHLRAVDVETSIARINGRNKLAWSEESIRKQLGWQNRLAAEAYLKEFYIFDQSRFAAAEPVARFNERVAAMATLVQQCPFGRPEHFAEMEQLILTIPPRFKDAIPAVAPLAQIEAQNREQFGPPAPKLDADALYRQAIATAERAQQR